MHSLAQFEYPEECKVVLRDSYENNLFYGLDSFDSKYLKILQAKFGCNNSFHTIPDRVKMEMIPFNWNERKQKFVLDDTQRVIVQVNRLEHMIISYSFARN
ncbi:MAG: hypothetical protein JW801_02235 [Bacteroidales bacterium]|nr:hypothetical protein [Bacteroidales bacterium]